MKKVIKYSICQDFTDLEGNVEILETELSLEEFVTNIVKEEEGDNFTTLEDSGWIHNVFKDFEQFIIDYEESKVCYQFLDL